MKVVVEHYGDAAFEALAAELAAVKGDDPLQPVTVVVPRGQVALATRRRLAARPGGILNVRFLTLASLAGELAASRMAATGRLPATGAVLGEAVRAVLAGPEARGLSPAADQPATVRALVQTCRDLRWAPPDALARLGSRGGRPSEVARAVDAVGRRLGGFYDEVDLLWAAVEAAREDPGAVGPLVVYLPARLRPAEEALLAALDSDGRLAAILGATGDALADAPTRDLCGRLRRRHGTPVDEAAFTAPVDRGSAVLCAPTADAEVLAAVRHLVAENARGTPLERMALAHHGLSPYPRLLHDVLIGAGIPFNGPGIRPLAATVAGRTILGAFELVDNGWRRDDVVAWASSAPILHRGREVPASGWDALSCDAGVVRGLDQWRERTGAHAAVLRARAELDEERGPELRRRAERCDEMAAFVEWLAARLAEPSGTWAEWSRWAVRLLADLLGDAARHAAWPAGEVAALDAVNEAAKALATVSPGRPGPGVFRAALAAELEAAAPLTSRFGHGVLVGRVEEVVGLDLDVLWVVGMIDGAFPPRPPDDVLVPDSVRELCGLPLRGTRSAEARRDYLGALAAARDRRLSFATGDQRQGRRQRPARPLLDTLGSLAGRRLFSRDLETLGHVEGYTQVPSFTAVVSGSLGEPVSPDDWDLRSLLRWVDAGRDPAGHFAVDEVMRAGFALQRGRRSERFTRYDGRVEGGLVASPVGHGTVQSPTGLETYATCPRRYLFSRLLGVEVRERPEEVLRISPKERGNVVHRVLERFVAESLARPAGEGPAPGAPWGADGEARLARIAGEVFADFERRGLTGRPALWDHDRSTIWGELRHFLREDDRYRAEQGAVPVAVEESFGGDGGASVDVDLGDGRSVRFRGTVDRIDRTASGGLFVLDYKTGTHRKEGDDPLQRGTRLQLAVYGLAARHRYRPVGPVEVRYWFVSDRAGPRGRYPQEGFRLDDGVERRFAQVVRSLVEGVEGGRFPGNPAGCDLCDFKTVCPPDRARSWERKRDDRWVADYRALAEG